MDLQLPSYTEAIRASGGVAGAEGGVADSEEGVAESGPHRVTIEITSETAEVQNTRSGCEERNRAQNWSASAEEGATCLVNENFRGNSAST